MKTTKLMRFALFAAILAAFSFVGCEKLETYSINPPSNLQSKIDSIAAVRASIDTGDTTFFEITTKLVGAEDYSNPWWETFSDYYSIPTSQLLHLEFVNHNGGSVTRWENWVAIITNNIERGETGYSEYFAIRADAAGWGNSDFDGGLISHDYTLPANLDDEWTEFLSTMDGAYVELDIDHSATGNVFITAKAVGTDGKVLNMTYNHPVSATEDIGMFFVCERSYLELKKGYFIPSKVTAIEDVEPTSLTITGTPSIVEIGDENFWANGVATVTFADGSSMVVDTADVVFSVIPDMTTLGEKTVIATYSKTKLGKYTKAVSTFYKLEVKNSVMSIAVTTTPATAPYAFFGVNAPKFDSRGLVVTATYSDGSTGILDNAKLQFTVPSTVGTQDVTISYVGTSSTVTTKLQANVLECIGRVGADDLSTAWWTEFSSNYPVASGESKTLTMYCFSTNAQSYHSPCTILRKADATEYGVVRMDNFGWGTGYDNIATTSNDWNFDTFNANINNSKVVIKVTNNGDDTADVRYDVTYANGEIHVQEYKGIAVGSADLNCAIVLESSYVVITSVE